MASYDFATALVEIGGTADDTTLLELFKQWYGLSDSSQDAEASTALNMAGDFCETYLDRIVLKREISEYFPHHFGAVVLHEYPVDTTQTLTVTLDGNAQSDYKIWLDRGQTGHLARQSMSQDVPMDWRHFEQVIVTYTGGYDPLPSDLANGIMYTAGPLFASNGAGTVPGGGGTGEVKSMSIYDVGSMSFDVGSSSGSSSGIASANGVIPDTAAEMIMRYKRMSV